MAFDVGSFINRQNAYIKQYATEQAMRSYSDFLSKQRGSRARVDTIKQYEAAQPQVVSGYARRGLYGPKVRSGLFNKGLQDYSNLYNQTLTDLDVQQSEQARLYELQSAGALDSFNSRIADLEAEKAAAIANAAKELFYSGLKGI